MRFPWLKHTHKWPVIRRLRMMALRRLHPLRKGRAWGTPIVRYYWGQFLEKNADDIRGRALEIGTTDTLRYYGRDRVQSPEALDLAPHSDEICVVADLARADHVPADSYDCFVNQFSMTVIYDIEAALYHSIRILKPGGVLLINFACVDYYLHRGLDMGTGSPLYMYWWFTPLQVEDLLHRLGLRDTEYTLTTHGNLFSRTAYQMNLMAEELTRKELDYADAGHPLLVSVRAVKPTGWHTARPTYREPHVSPKEAPARLSDTTGHYGNEYGK